jgi:hypothetical protein
MLGNSACSNRRFCRPLCLVFHTMKIIIAASCSRDLDVKEMELKPRKSENNIRRITMTIGGTEYGVEAHELINAVMVLSGDINIESLMEDAKKNYYS